MVPVRKEKRNNIFEKSKASVSASTNTQEFYEKNEPLFVLKVELDNGAHYDNLIIYPGDDPKDVIEIFGRKNNLSEQSKTHLLN